MKDDEKCPLVEEDGWITAHPAIDAEDAEGEESEGFTIDLGDVVIDPFKMPSWPSPVEPYKTFEVPSITHAPQCPIALALSTGWWSVVPPVCSCGAQIMEGGRVIWTSSNSETAE